jgi:hypothetical protein
MFARVSRKRLVAAIAGLLLLLCQSVALAQACSLLGVQSDQSQSRPCHSTGEQQDANTSSGEKHCESISPVASGFSLFGIDQLPAIVVKFAGGDLAAAPISSPLEPPLLRIEAPPLRIVHCCLRN